MTLRHANATLLLGVALACVAFGWAVVIAFGAVDPVGVAIGLIVGVVVLAAEKWLRLELGGER